MNYFHTCILKVISSFHQTDTKASVDWTYSSQVLITQIFILLLNTWRFLNSNEEPRLESLFSRWHLRLFRQRSQAH